jgi:ABC-2 type transport system permease protein
VAGILSFTMIFAMIFGLSFLGQSNLLTTELFTPLRPAIDALQIFHHVDDFTHGIVDTRQVFFYLTGATLALIFSILGVEAKLLSS